MIKRLFAALLICLLLMGAAACTPTAAGAQPQAAQNTPDPGQTEAPPQDTPASVPGEPLKIMALKGPTGMGMVALMGEEYAKHYDIALAASPDEVSAALLSGSVDVAAVPVNLASILYTMTSVIQSQLNHGSDVVMLAVNTLGVLYVLENGDSIQSIQDLSGTTLAATGQGATPEYILNDLLEKNGVANVNIEYYAEHSELATLLAAGDISLGMLPEPNVTAALMQNGQLRVALDLTALWSNVNDTTLVQGCIVARKSAIEGREADIARFLTDYAASTAFVNNHKKKASMLMEQYGIVPKAAIAKAAISKSNIVCLTGDEMRAAAAGMLEVLFAANPKSVGGALPGDDFYYAG